MYRYFLFCFLKLLSCYQDFNKDLDLEASGHLQKDCHGPKDTISYEKSQLELLPTISQQLLTYLKQNIHLLKQTFNNPNYIIKINKS